MTAVARHTIPRNQPCPCGSGRRYKDCHGSLHAGEGATVSPVPAQRHYRPDGDDWDGIDDKDQDRLGELMERALVEQKAGRVRDAERLYRAVLEQAPGTHDALHMLGVVRLGLGDLADAERLIKQAMTLRPAYAAIEKNRSIVERSIAARDRRGIETVSEHALSLLMESLAEARTTARSPEASSAAVCDVRESSRVPLHVVAPAFAADRDAIRLVRSLRGLLAPLGATFWNESKPLADGKWVRFEAGKIDVATRHYPRSGPVVLAGIDDESEAGLCEALDRVLVFVPRASPAVLLERLRRIAADGARSLTVVFDSHARAARFGGAHRVVPPAVDAGQWPSPTGSGRFRDGILRIATCGQDRLVVNAPNDADWLRAVTDTAGRLDLFDPGPLREAVGTSRAIVCFPGDPVGRRTDLARCDLYLHRPMPWWAEDPHTLFGAMLSGIAALCPRDSVYAEYVNDGIDGWLYNDRDDALRIIAALRNDPERSRAAGEAALRSARTRFAPSALAAAYMAVIEEWMRNA